MARIVAATNQVVQQLIRDWELAEVAPLAAPATPEALAARSPPWLAAQVPGTVAGALRALGSFGFDAARDFDASDWWYRTRFTTEVAAEGERLVLSLGGLATLAEVWLNGTSILVSDNMFVEHAVNVTDVVRADNELVIRFASLTSALAKRRPRPRWRTRLVANQQLRWHRTTLLGRIPAWSPPVAAVGPFRAVSLARRRGPWPVGASVRGVLEHGRALARAKLSLPPDARIRVASLCVGESRGPLAIEADGSIAGELVVRGAELWWPHTHGAQPLYPVTVTVVTEHGETTYDFGQLAFRRIEADVGDGGFGLRVNGVDVFCRGACWTPDDIVTLGGELEPTSVLELARAAGMNMLRVGGTMLYENAAFYAACDRLGILVWQDFMFANMDYPGEDPAFSASVRREATDFLARTEANACVAVLCGNSEIEQQVAMLGLPRSSWKQPLFETELHRLSVAARSDAVYLSSTPTGGALPFQVDQGVSHYYGVGAYLRPSTDARLAGVRFTSECLGFANVPEPSSVEALLDGRAPFHDARWKERVPRDGGAGWDFDDVRDHYTRQLFGLDPIALRAVDPERALSFARVTSGEVMMRALVEWRRRSSTCRGALIWFLKDLWLGAGWGLIDALGTPKAAYYYVRRALQPLAVFLSDEGLNGLFVELVNDTAAERIVDVRLLLLRDGNTTVADVSRRGITLGARQRLTLASAELFDQFVDTTYAYHFGPPGHEVAIATLTDSASGERLGQWTHTLVGPGQSSDLGVQAVTHEVAAGRYELSLRADKFVTAVAIDLTGLQPEDAYFDLAPGEERRIALRGHVGKEGPRGTVWPLNARVQTRVLVHKRSEREFAFTGATKGATLRIVALASNPSRVRRLLTRSRWVQLAAGALGCLALQIAVGAAHAEMIHRRLPPPADDVATPLQPLRVDPASILAGEPRFSASQYFASSDGSTVSGIWVCEGPGTFRWEHYTDESLYVLDGTARVEYEGVKHELQPGDVTFFRAGTSTTWRVEGRVRKSFTLHNPGRLTRWLRRVF